MDYSQAFTVVFGHEISEEIADLCYTKRGHVGSVRCVVSRLIREASLRAPKGGRSSLERSLRVHADRLQADLYERVAIGPDGARGTADLESEIGL